MNRMKGVVELYSSRKNGIFFASLLLGFLRHCQMIDAQAAEMSK